uniref:Putative secreted protein n=1 Tax=Ixodes ricinus TaxID=34613 RepID=A0A147BE35_IXORI
MCVLFLLLLILFYTLPLLLRVKAHLRAQWWLLRSTHPQSKTRGQKLAAHYQNTTKNATKQRRRHRGSRRGTSYIRALRGGAELTTHGSRLAPNTIWSLAPRGKSGQSNHLNVFLPPWWIRTTFFCLL